MRDFSNQETQKINGLIIFLLQNAEEYIHVTQIAGYVMGSVTSINLTDEAWLERITSLCDGLCSRGVLVKSTVGGDVYFYAYNNEKPG